MACARFPSAIGARDCGKTTHPRCWRLTAAWFWSRLSNASIRIRICTICSSGPWITSMPTSRACARSTISSGNWRACSVFPINSARQNNRFAKCWAPSRHQGMTSLRGWHPTQVRCHRRRKVGFHRRGNRRKGGGRSRPRRAVPSLLGLRVLTSFACGPGGAALPGPGGAALPGLRKGRVPPPGEPAKGKRTIPTKESRSVPAWASRSHLFRLRPRRCRPTLPRRRRYTWTLSGRRARGPRGS